MALINKRFFHFATKAKFEAKLNANSIPNNAIVFIKAEKLIWTHGEYYSSNAAINNPTITIKKNGSTKGYFTLNQSASKTIDITTSVNITSLLSGGETLYTPLLTLFIPPILSNAAGIGAEITQVVYSSYMGTNYYYKFAIWLQKNGSASGYAVVTPLSVNSGTTKSYNLAYKISIGSNGNYLYIYDMSTSRSSSKSLIYVDSINGGQGSISFPSRYDSSGNQIALTASQIGGTLTNI